MVIPLDMVPSFPRMLLARCEDSPSDNDHDNNNNPLATHGLVYSNRFASIACGVLFTLKTETYTIII